MIEVGNVIYNDEKTKASIEIDMTGEKENSPMWQFYDAIINTLKWEESMSLVHELLTALEGTRKD